MCISRRESDHECRTGASGLNSGGRQESEIITSFMAAPNNAHIRGCSFNGKNLTASVAKMLVEKCGDLSKGFLGLRCTIIELVLGM
jgi:hypothetical protein